jgi:FMN phosphatase YigB (HAD superfamily)
MIFIFDLDDTLMDTKSLKDQLFRLMQESGANMDEILESYEKTYTMPELYTPVTHIEHLYNQNNNINKDFFLKSYENIDYKALLFPKTEEILAEARELGAVVLMTRGHHLFQARKLISSGIDDYFDDIIITNKTKDEYVPRFTAYPKVIVINDKASENEQMASLAPEFIYINAGQIEKDWAKIKSELL